MPFTIRLKDRVGGSLQPLHLKLDPGSKTTGVALVREHEANANHQHVVWLVELQHRGLSIRGALEQRRGFRRRRRSELRYRAPRFDNRTRRQGWLAPSLQHRIDTTVAWVERLCHLAPVVALSQELVRFDTQALQDPEIRGVAYQQGTLAGYELREYLLEKWGRACAYCDAKEVPLEIEHIHPRSRGGSDRVSNLTLACRRCNQRKGDQEVHLFLAHDPERAVRLLAQARAPLRDAAAVNSTRWALFRRLQAYGKPVAVSTGGRTKWNRMRLDLPKTHALVAACVGPVEQLHGWARPVLHISATGRGSYQRTRLNRYGFPRGYLMRRKSVHGFQTGDQVMATVARGKKAGVHVGRVAVRASGSFNLQTAAGVIQGISHRYCRLLQRSDGYGYRYQQIAAQKGEAREGHAARAALSLPDMNVGVSRVS